MEAIITDKTCCKKVKKQDGYGGTESVYICNKPATYTNGSHFFCRKHSKMGRFIIRVGDVGEILNRFDTEEELRKNFIDYKNIPNVRMQKVTSSQRKDIY